MGLGSIGKVGKVRKLIDDLDFPAVNKVDEVAPNVKVTDEAVTVDKQEPVEDILGQLLNDLDFPTPAKVADEQPTTSLIDDLDFESLDPKGFKAVEGGTDEVASVAKQEPDITIPKVSEGVANNKYVRFVPIEELKKYIQENRRTQKKGSDVIAGTLDKPTDETIAKIISDLREGKPLIKQLELSYDVSKGQLRLTDGNTRLVALEDAGYTHAPVQIMRRQLVWDANEAPVKMDKDAAYASPNIVAEDIGLSTTTPQTNILNDLEQLDPKGFKAVDEGLQEVEGDFAYHAGDLGFGRDTALGRIDGSRGSGHLGTGGYVLSKPPTTGSGLEGREVHKIDLGKYNLFKPKGREEGMNLHSTLRKVNDLVDSIEDGAKWSDKEIANRVDSVVFELSTNSGLARKTSGEKFGDAALEEMIKKAVDAAASKRSKVRHTNAYEDSASTSVMKSLGYEGVDVRHIKDMDNSRYGTVIYKEFLEK